MFGTRDHGAAFLLCLLISVGAHWALLRGGRVDLGPRGRRTPRPGMSIPFLGLSPPRLGPGMGEPLHLIVVREADGEVSAEPAVSRNDVPVPLAEAAGSGAAAESASSRAAPVGGGSPFVLDSLDLRLAWPWLAPAPAVPPSADRLTGLQRALWFLRQSARAAEDSSAIALDTRYGKFGLSAEGLLLGPIVVPLPMAPYRSAARRETDQMDAEIRQQGEATSMRDDDIEGQRERVLDWWRRRRSGSEGP